MRPPGPASILLRLTGADTALTFFTHTAKDFSSETLEAKFPHHCCHIASWTHTHTHIMDIVYHVDVDETVYVWSVLKVFHFG